MNRIKYWSYALIAVCVMLYLVWPLAHTIAARKLLMVAAAGISIYLWVKNQQRAVILKSSWFVFLMLLLAWVVFHAAFISQNGQEAWKELVGQWLPAYIAVLGGIGLALASRQIEGKLFERILLATLLVQPLLYLFVSVFTSIKLGHLAIGYWGADEVKIGTDLKTSLTINAELLAALSGARLVGTFNVTQAQGNKYVWLLLIALSMYVGVFSGSLNAVLVMAGSLAMALIMITYKFSKNLSRVVVITLAIGGIAAIYAVSTAPKVTVAMQRALSNVSESVDVGNNQRWKHDYGDEKIPINSLGEPVPASFYTRIARATVGLGLVIEHPYGYGVSRHAYQQLVEQKFPDAKMMGSSENGYLNLLCAVGIPAVLLLLLSVASLYRMAKSSDSGWRKPVIWMIGISLAHFGLDAIERDHFFEIYLFLLALAAAKFCLAQRATGH